MRILPFTVSVALPALLIALPAAAQLDPAALLAEAVDCSQVTASCSGAVDSDDEAKACFCEGTAFAEDARSVIAGGGVFGASALDCTLEPGGCILPNAYEFQLGLQEYSESRVDQAIDWASTRPLPRDPDMDWLLFQASFRKASAHGMFGDDRLLRGLNAAFDASATGEPVYRALVHLDSRVCRPPAAALWTGAQALCQGDADCSGSDLCRAARFDDASVGVYGAVQEYRRAEAALAVAMRELGGERFVELDELLAGCRGGCASRLLLRLGAMKARAQAERVDRLWRRAVATGDVLPDAPACTVGRIGETCSVDRDCDLGMQPGRCGDSPGSRTLVLLREAAGEALAEASLAEALYERVLSSQAISDSDDLALRAGALVDLSEASTRSARGVTPFGLPSDYVPVLTTVQQQFLDCLGDCPTNQCDRTSVFTCLERFTEGGGALDVFAAAEQAQNDATLAADEFAERARQSSIHETETRNDFRRVLVRLFGASCDDLQLSCDCDPAAAAAGQCVSFEGEVWIVEGIRCDADDPLATCNVSQAVDGEIEAQIQIVRNAQLALENDRAELDRNRALYDQTLAKFAALKGIEAESCESIRAVLEQAQNQVDDAITDRAEEVANSGKDFGGAAAAGFNLGGSLGSAIGGILSEEGGGLIGSLAGGALGALTGTIACAFVCDDGNEEKEKDLELQRLLSEIQAEKERQIQAIQCVAQLQVLNVEEDDALFQVETERQRLVASTLETRGRVLEAIVELGQLLTVLRQSKQTLDEAVALRGIWEDQQFRHPQNYRTLALASQLEAADEFRTAQVVTWIILRAAAYDLARPDFATPETFLPSDVLGVSECRKSACSNDGSACGSDADCGGGVCQPITDGGGFADSDGSCSLRAVFAARTVDDLRHLVWRANAELAAPPRTLACEGECQRTLSLRDLFTDRNLGAAQPGLGSVLRQSPLLPGNVAVLEFGVSLKRGFELCPTLPDGSTQCQPGGVDGISFGAQSPADDNTPDAWNARITTLKGFVEFDPGRDPSLLLCRNPGDGSVFDASFSLCAGAQDGDACTATPDCSDELGNPVVCRCRTLVDVRPKVDLVQLGPGIVRTAAAEPDGPGAVDSFLRYRMRRSELPILGRAPQLQIFRVPGLTLARLGDPSVPDNPNAQGIPVASPRWQLRVLSAGVVKNADIWFDEYLASIRDIVLVVKYQGFDL